MGKRFTIIFRSNMSKLFPVMVFIPPSSSFFRWLQHVFPTDTGRYAGKLVAAVLKISHVYSSETFSTC